jgi:hypothetical protein
MLIIWLSRKQMGMGRGVERENKETDTTKAISNGKNQAGHWSSRWLKRLAGWRRDLKVTWDLMGQKVAPPGDSKAE